MKQAPPTIKELFPFLNPEELKEAEENLDLYLKLVLRILERMESNPQVVALTRNDGMLSCTPPQPEASP